MVDGGGQRRVNGLNADQRAAALRISPTFAGVPSDALRMLAETMVEETFAPGEVVCEEGDDAPGAYLIASGCVEVSIAGKAIRTLGAGEMIGEYGMFQSGVRRARIAALEPTSLLFVEYSRCLEVLRQHPDAMLGLWRTTVLRLLEEQRGR